MAASLRTDPDQMRLTLGALDELYGGIEPYLLDCGIESADLARVRERIVG